MLIFAVIPLLGQRVNDTPAEIGAKLDLFGTALSALGLGLIVFGILKSGTWGVVQRKPEAPQWLGLSPVVWLILGGGGVLALFLRREGLRIGRGQGALLNPQLLRNIQMRSGVLLFLFMFPLHGQRRRAGDHGQRVFEVVRVVAVPAVGPGRRDVVERGLTSMAELEAIVADYLQQGRCLGRGPG